MEINELINRLKQKTSDFINSIDGLIESFKYTQKWSASEVLAMEEYFPIYGMPVHNTALIHKNPNHEPNIRNWPIEQGRIDRDSEISISEFAPLQEVIKDKEVIKCVGVGWLAPQGHSRFIRGERYSRNRNVNVCRTCGSVLFDNGASCSKCNEIDGQKFFRFESWEPEYYIADLNGVDIYNGQVNSTRQNISEYPDLPDENFIDGPPSTNYKIRSQKGCLVRAITNDFSGYRFNRVSRGPILPGVFIEHEASKSVRTVEWQQNSGNLDIHENLIALTTEKITDFLLITLKDWPVQYRYGDRSSDLSYCTKGAWRSLAEIIGQGIIRMEDIEPQEISVGIKPEIFFEPDGTRSWQWSIYIADNLDNGAGYSSKYDNPEELTRLFNYIETYVVSFLLSDEHNRTCRSSCYQCIRHYGNRFYHESLDWRLGVDLLNLLLNPESSITRMNSYWEYLLTEVLPFILEEFSSDEDGNFEIHQIAGYTTYCHSTRPFALFARHPLLDPISCIDVTDARNTILSLTDDRITNVLSFSIYDFIRNPLRAWQKIRGSL